MHLCSASNDQIPLLDLANIYTELVSLMGVYKMGMSDILATCFVVSYIVGVYGNFYVPTFATKHGIAREEVQETHYLVYNIIIYRMLYMNL